MLRPLLALTSALVLSSTPLGARAGPLDCAPASLEDHLAIVFQGILTDFDRSSMTVIRGILRAAETCEEDGPGSPKYLCQLKFEVEEQPFDHLAWLTKDLGLPAEPPLRRVTVQVFRDPRETAVPEIGTEWIVVVSSFGGSGDRGSGVSPRCGSWLGQVRDGEVYFEVPGTSAPAHRPWTALRARLLAPVEAVTPEQRREALERMLARAEKRRAQEAAERAAQPPPKPPPTVDELLQVLQGDDSRAIGNAFYDLTARRAPQAIPRALELLRSKDDYVWMNAAHYLGRQGRAESVPYLIKALRHTAWRANADRAAMLQQLTGQAFGERFEDWRAWWEKGHPEPFDWESGLGPRPRR